MTQQYPGEPPRQPAFTRHYGQPPQAPPPQAPWPPYGQQPPPQGQWPQYQPPQPPGPPPRRRRKHRGLRAFAFSCLGLLVVVIAVVASNHGSGQAPAPAAPTSAPAPAAAAAASSPAPAGAAVITYVVTGTPGADVTYGPAGSDLTGSVPMRVRQKLGDAAYYAIQAQLQGSGSVTVQILINGRVISSGHATGGYNIANAEIVQDPLTGKWENAN